MEPRGEKIVTRNGKITAWSGAMTGLVAGAVTVFLAAMGASATVCIIAGGALVVIGLWTWVVFTT